MRRRVISFVLALAVTCSTLYTPALALDAGKAQEPAGPTDMDGGDVSTDENAKCAEESAETDEVKKSSCTLVYSMVENDAPANEDPLEENTKSEELSYLDEQGNLVAYDGNYVIMTSDTTSLTGWYLVEGKVTVNSRINTTGEVHLVLADGAELNASQGIEVGENSALTITAQSDEENTMGELTAKGGEKVAAIGSGFYGDCEAITINGGIITATSQGDGAAIGSGFYGDCGAITINGGIITATSQDNGAAIGSGFCGDCGDITVNGGTVAATSKGYGAGIGSGFSTRSDQGGAVNPWDPPMEAVALTITINGGMVTAISQNDGAGIGSGYVGSNYHVTINGGTVNATSNGDGAGIGSGYATKKDDQTEDPGHFPVEPSGSETCDITINGGTVNATSKGDGAGIGSGFVGTASAVTITGGVITAVSNSTWADSIGSGRAENKSSVTIGNAVIYADKILDSDDSGNWNCIWFQPSINSGVVYGTATLGADLTIQSDETLTVPSGTTLVVPVGVKLINEGEINNSGTIRMEGSLEGNPPRGNAAEYQTTYLTPEGAVETVDAKQVTAELKDLSDGWYVITGDLNLDAIEIQGQPTNLILADGAHVTISGSIHFQGIGTQLNIYAQSNDEATMGRLTAYNGVQTAEFGQLTINGGFVTIKNEKNGAGISSYDSSVVTINGGIVNVNGSSAGISSHGGTISINGGTVTATGTAGSGIGDSGDTVRITGGTVTAKGDAENSADIGGNFSTGDDGRAVIYANSIADQSGKDSWSCILFGSDKTNGAVYGDVTVPGQLILPENATLTIPVDTSLTVNQMTVPDSTAVSVQGGLANEGRITNNGKIQIQFGGTYTGEESAPNPVVYAGVAYLDENGEQKTTSAPLSFVTDSTTQLADGWYVVDKNVSLSGGLTVTGNAKLILSDSTTMSCGEGIFVKAPGSLTIYAQSDGGVMGKLIAHAQEKTAIGGDGDIIINGGDISATAKNDPNYPSGPMGIGGTGSVTINGGTINAQGSYGKAAIGGTQVTITDGLITANGGTDSSADITGSLSTGVNGNAVIYANSISDSSDTSHWSCIWIRPSLGTGNVYGDVTLPENFALPNYRLYVLDGSTLTVSDLDSIDGFILVNLGGTYKGPVSQDDLGKVQYQIGWDADGDGSPESGSTKYYTYGTMPNYYGDIPTKPNTDQYTYTFIGWDPEVTNVTQPMLYTAQFGSALNQYAVSVQQSVGGTVDFENYNENIPVDYGMIITFRVNVADGYSKTESFAVKVNGTPLTEQNGVYSFALKENSTITVEGIEDITPPSNVTVSYGTDSFREFINNMTFGLFFKDTVTVNFSAADAGSGVSSFSYRLGLDEQTISAENGQASITIKAEFKGQITGVTAKDFAGNTSDEKAYECFAVEGTAPNGPVINTGEYTGGWTADDVTANVSNSSSTSGIQKYQYSTDGGQTWQDLKTIEETQATATEPYNAEKATLTISRSMAGDCLFRAVSNAGNISSISRLNLRVDKVKPTITALGNTENYLVRDTVKLSVMAGQSGIVKVEVQHNQDEWTDITESYGKGYTVTENGRYTFRVTNGASVTTETTLTYTKLDTSKPVLTLDTHGYTEGTWASGNVMITAAATQNIAPVTVEYKVDNGAWQQLSGDLVADADTTGTKYTFRAASASGVAGDEVSITVKRDASSPEGTVTVGENTFKKLINQITFGLFFKEDVEVTFSGHDAVSGVSDISYLRSETLLTAEELLASTEWADYINPITEKAENNSRFVYYGKVTDNAGNTTIFGADGVIFDTAAPAFAGVADGNTYYTTQVVTVTDVNLGTLTLNGMTVASPVTLPGNTDATYTLKATDKAGNSASITVTMQKLTSLETPLEGLTPDTVTSKDKEKLEQTLDAVKELLQGSTVTEQEKSQLEELQNTVENMLDALDKAQSAGSTEAVDKVENIASDNVKPEDRENLETAKEDLETALTEHAGNYTNEEKAQMEETLSRVEAALEALNKVQEVQDSVDSLPDTLEPDELDIIQNAESAREQYDKLTDYEKELLGTAAVDKLNALLDAADDYRIQNGDGSTWKQGGTNTLTITANGSPVRLVELQVDDRTLTAGQYTIRSGSTIVTLSPNYLNTLAAGQHTLTFVYENGRAVATFTVVAAPASGNTGKEEDLEDPSSDASNNSGAGSNGNAATLPQTGDNSSMALWGGLMSVSALGLLVLVLVKRKRN